MKIILWIFCNRLLAISCATYTKEMKDIIIEISKTCSITIHISIGTKSLTKIKITSVTFYVLNIFNTQHVLNIFKTQ